MRRVCFIGNSHVGAIKKALEENKAAGRSEKAEITIFGSHGDTLDSAYLKDGIIKSDRKVVKERFLWTSGYASEIDISSFDELVFVAGLSQFSILSYITRDEVPELSQGVFEAIWNSVGKNWAYKIALEASKVSEHTQLTYLGMPFKSEQSPIAQKLLSSLQSGETSALDRVKKIQGRIEEKAGDSIEANFRVKGPPKIALEEYGLFTRHEYCKGSVRLSEDLSELHTNDDYNHMNADYGKLLLEEFSG